MYVFLNILRVEESRELLTAFKHGLGGGHIYAIAVTRQRDQILILIPVIEKHLQVAECMRAETTF